MTERRSRRLRTAVATFVRGERQVGHELVEAVLNADLPQIYHLCVDAPEWEAGDLFVIIRALQKQCPAEAWGYPGAYDKRVRPAEPVLDRVREQPRGPAPEKTPTIVVFECVECDCVIAGDPWWFAPLARRHVAWDDHFPRSVVAIQSPAQPADFTVSVPFHRKCLERNLSPEERHLV